MGLNVRVRAKHMLYALLCVRSYATYLAIADHPVRFGEALVADPVIDPGDQDVLSIS